MISTAYKVCVKLDYGHAVANIHSGINILERQTTHNCFMYRRQNAAHKEDREMRNGL